MSLNGREILSPTSFSSLVGMEQGSEDFETSRELIISFISIGLVSWRNQEGYWNSRFEVRQGSLTSVGAWYLFIQVGTNFCKEIIESTCHFFICI